VNSAGNANWYYEIKNGSSTKNAKSGTGLTPELWHNFTYVQEGSQGQVYVDEILASSTSVSLKPSDIASVITECFLGKSPFSGDGVMENAFFDNFRIFGAALSAAQVNTICRSTSKMSSSLMSDGIRPHVSVGSALYTDIYNIDGKLIRRQTAGTKFTSGLEKGTYIIGGKKVSVK
jgi:hypothetical protein